LFKKACFGKRHGDKDCVTNWFWSLVVFVPLFNMYLSCFVIFARFEQVSEQLKHKAGMTKESNINV
jgi:hypothetical protein